MKLGQFKFHHITDDKSSPRSRDRALFAGITREESGFPINLGSHQLKGPRNTRKEDKIIISHNW